MVLWPFRESWNELSSDVHLCSDFACNQREYSELAFKSIELSSASMCVQLVFIIHHPILKVKCSDLLLQSFRENRSSRSLNFNCPKKFHRDLESCLDTNNCPKIVIDTAYRIGASIVQHNALILSADQSRHQL